MTLRQVSVQWRWLVACTNPVRRWSARFDFFTEGKRYERLLERKSGRIEVPGYAEMAARAEELKRFVDADDARICLTHNDFFMLNFLIDDQDDMSLIDWEYSGMSDYASDFGTFTVCCQLSEEEASRALAYYFGRERLRRSAVTTSPSWRLRDGAGTRGRCSKRQKGHGWRVAVRLLPLREGLSGQGAGLVPSGKRLRGAP